VVEVCPDVGGADGVIDLAFKHDLAFTGNFQGTADKTGSTVRVRQRARQTTTTTRRRFSFRPTYSSIVQRVWSCL
jgi:hypothetical protein